MTQQNAGQPGHWSLNRRDLIRAGFVGFTGFSISQGIMPLTALALPERRKARAVIMLWMSGGASQLDTWDPKPGANNGGPIKGVETKAKGVQYSEYLSQLAREHGDKIAVVRTVKSNIPDHELGSYYMHTGYPRNPTVVHPAIGSLVAKEGHKPEDQLPGYVSINGGTAGEGFLPATFAPFTVGNPMGRGGDNMDPWNGVTEKRQAARKSFLEAAEGQFKKEHGHEIVQKRYEVYQQAFRLIEGKAKESFDVSKEDQKTRDLYGMTPFGQGCLMARRLVQAGVKFVEVRHGGWDTHNDNFTAVERLSKPLDQGFSGLLTDLSAQGMLSETLVVWMSEFGRTPNINENNGRDHWARCFSVAMAGAGIKGGQAVGDTGPEGVEAVDRPTDLREIFATIFDRLGINSRKQNYSPEGRPIRYVKDDIQGDQVTPIQPMKELVG
jgi:hypothetical protein